MMRRLIAAKKVTCESMLEDERVEAAPAFDALQTLLVRFLVSGR
jgi:hypothetical protein